MRNSPENFNSEPRPDIRSSLAGAGGHGSEKEKRASVAEVFAKLKDIFSILPEDSKRRIGNQVEYIRKNPEQAIEIIRNEIEAQRQIIDLLDNEISTDEALNMLDELIQKEKVQ